jgi:hypothetical protein
MSADCEVWLYGSRARGAADDASDTDLLIVGNAAAAPDPITTYPYPRICLSHYDWVEIDAMRSYGSLFLHHLKMEGIRLDAPTPAPGRLEKLLEELPPFTRACHDLATFRRAAAEAKRSLADHGWPDLELQVMATVVRHAAILASYCIGQADYGRETPFHTAGRHLSYDPSRITRLARLATEFRYLPLGDERWQGRIRDGLDWLADAEQFLDDLNPVIDGYEALLRQIA